MPMLGLIFGIGITIYLAKNLSKTNSPYKAYTCPDHSNERVVR